VLGLLLVWYGYQLGGVSANKRFTAQQQQDYPAYSRVQVG
jgi:hypothetical protein